MKFLVVLCLLAFAAADEDKAQDKKTQSIDPTQSTGGLTQPPASLLSSQVFPPTSFFNTNDAVSNLAYTGLNSNVSPIQPVAHDYFTPQQVNPQFPVRSVLPGSSSVVGSPFPVAGVFQGVNGLAPAIAQPYVQPVSAQFPTGVVDPNAAVTPAQAPVYRFLPAEGLTGIPTQGLQPVQQVGLAAIPAFTSGILSSFANGALQGQNIPAGIQQVLKNPTGAGIPQTIAASPLANIYRQA